MLKKTFLPLAFGIVVLSVAGCGGTNGALGLITGTPVITAITPNPVVRGQAITITGVNLNGTQTAATLSGPSTVTLNASSGNTTSVVVAVPSTIPVGTYNVTLITSDSAGDVSSASNGVSIQCN